VEAYITPSSYFARRDGDADLMHSRYYVSTRLCMADVVN
jgi:hypothetical protein